jgi:hypothetical protein
MDPTHNTSPDESALPNVPPQIQANGGAFVAAPPISPAPAPGAASPVAPPPSDGWLPPTVPVQAGGQAANQGGSSQAGTAQAPSLNVSAPHIADDGDVIEKEWVDRAKQIVAHTRQDPYRQTKELHKFKAEYMQKRYNKTIEAVEE